MQTLNIFIIGLNGFNLKKLKKLNEARFYNFHNLLDPSDIIDAESYGIESILQKAREELRSYKEAPDAIVGYVDFPVSTIVPILAEEFGTYGTSLESLLKCEHKYWSRMEQYKVIPDNIPEFQTFDPFDGEAFNKLEVPLPLWIKPVKSFASHLGFRIESKDRFENACQQIQKKIPGIDDAFQKVTQRVDLPEEILELPGSSCIAESIIGGNHQCTLEGAVHERNPYFHGMIDSVRIPGTSVFERNEYPSELPNSVQERMRDLASRFIERADFDNAAFNIEFYWDSEADEIRFLEINTRVAKHHSELFEKVDGVPNQKAALDVAFGREPIFPSDQGEFKKAAVFFVREKEDQYVHSIPSKDDIEGIEKEFPGSTIQLRIEEGIKLSELHEQDSYSYIIGLIYVGGNSSQDLLVKKNAIEERLGIEYEEVPEGS